MRNSTGEPLRDTPIEDMRARNGRVIVSDAVDDFEPMVFDGAVSGNSYPEAVPANDERGHQTYEQSDYERYAESVRGNSLLWSERIAEVHRDMLGMSLPQTDEGNQRERETEDRYRPKTTLLEMNYMHTAFEMVITQEPEDGEYFIMDQSEQGMYPQKYIIENHLSRNLHFFLENSPVHCPAGKRVTFRRVKDKEGKIQSRFKFVSIGSILAQ